MNVRFAQPDSEPVNVLIDSYSDEHFYSSRYPEQRYPEVDLITDDLDICDILYMIEGFRPDNRHGDGPSYSFISHMCRLLEELDVAGSDETWVFDETARENFPNDYKQICAIIHVTLRLESLEIKDMIEQLRDVGDVDGEVVEVEYSTTTGDLFCELKYTTDFIKQTSACGTLIPLALMDGYFLELERLRIKANAGEIIFWSDIAQASADLYQAAPRLRSGEVAEPYQSLIQILEEFAESIAMCSTAVHVERDIIETLRNSFSRGSSVFRPRHTEKMSQECRICLCDKKEFAILHPRLDAENLEAGKISEGTFRHSICTECADKLIDHSTDVRCPLCRNSVELKIVSAYE
jgi:hypothetical protein